MNQVANKHVISIVEKYKDRRPNTNSPKQRSAKITVAQSQVYEIDEKTTTNNLDVDTIRSLYESVKNELSILESEIYASTNSVKIKGVSEKVYEQKEIIQRIDDVKEKVSELDKKLAVFEEISKKLNKLDNIEQVVNDIKTDMPKDTATKDFVGKEINGVKLWLMITAIGTGLSFIGMVATVIRLFSK